jgi:Cu+-exporting ATPase
MAKAKDPVCGMTVDTEKAPAKGVYGGQAVFFCSTACRKEYEKTHRAD